MAKKTITPIRWSNSDEQDSVILDVVSSGGDFQTFCDIEWRLMTAESQDVTDMGTMKITGADYTAWSGDDDFPFDFVVAQHPLGGKITVTGDYVPPTV